MDRLIRYDRASRIGWRLLVACAAGWGAVSVGIAGHLASALLLSLVALLAGADIIAATARRVYYPSASSVDLDAAREIDRLRALLDTVSSALLAIEADGRVVFANRAARRLVGGDVAALDDIAVLGPIAVEAIRALPAGARRIVRVQDGRSLFAWSGAFTVPGKEPQRLLSLQWVAGELDAVELEAWHAMTRVLTHEMMNSLTPIVSLAESVAAMSSPEPSVLQPALATIARRGAHLLHFIERYRALGDLPRPEPVAFDVATFLADIVDAMAPELAQCDIGLSLQVVGTKRRVIADPDLIERAVTNLLRNAVEAVRGREKAKIVLSVSAKPNECLIVVQDNGPGISRDRIDDVFVPFYSTKLHGSGIGLPLARQIALLHQGSLIATTGQNEGARLELRLLCSPGQPASYN